MRASPFISVLLVPILLTLAACSSAPSKVGVFPEPPIDPIRSGMETAILAGGCFWGIEGVFEGLIGVKDVVSGYSGGARETAVYELVGNGTTGHAESVSIIYDASVISYGTLLKVFFQVAHDPTQLNYQGPDHGTQYRSAIFYSTPAQQETAERYIAALNQAKVYPAAIVTEVTPLQAFYAAEDYHQDFMALNPDYPYIVYWDQPKIEQLKKVFPELLANPISDANAGEQWYGYPILAANANISPPITRSDAEWRQALGEFAWGVLRHADTEEPYTGDLLEEHRAGTFYSAATGQPLFRTSAKFESGTGWPSFSRPIAADAVILRWDLSFGSRRVEVLDSSSGSHLGHVFEDGPEKSASFAEGTGLRFCMNSVSLLFVPDGGALPELVKDYLAKYQPKA